MVNKGLDRIRRILATVRIIIKVALKETLSSMAVSTYPFNCFLRERNPIYL